MRWVLAAALAAAATTVTAQAPPDLETLLARVGQRIAEYYARAQNVVCTEKQTMQPVSRDYMPSGMARITEYELHVEADAGGESTEAKVVRELVRVNGKPPREKDGKRRDGCTDGNPLSPEPLAFLLPSHRDEYTFAAAGPGKGKDRNTFVIEFKARKPEGNGELSESESGRDDCYSWTSPVVEKGRIWIDAVSYQVVRIEKGLAGYADVSVPWKLQRAHNFENSMVVERQDTIIRYKTVPFNDPDEAMLLPESIETVFIIRGSLQSMRNRQVFSDYRRFLTAGRMVK
ncbi:MAG TPA: hypothetical protein VGH34_10155 [Vicinamibacterales bacterium]